jgi:hypothetical protein
VYELISCMARAVGPALTEKGLLLIDALFSSGPLSEPLRKALDDLARCAPGLFIPIRGRVPVQNFGIWSNSPRFR